MDESCEPPMPLLVAVAEFGDVTKGVQQVLADAGQDKAVYDGRMDINSYPLVPHIYASVNWVSIGSDISLSPVRHQAIAWTNADLLSIGTLRTNFSEIRIKIQNVSFMKMHSKMSSAKWRPLCPGGDELTSWIVTKRRPFCRQRCHVQVLEWKFGSILTHWGRGRDKMAAAFRTTFSNASSWMKMFESGLKFHWSFFLRVEFTICEHWFR